MTPTEGCRAPGGLAIICAPTDAAARAAADGVAQDLATRGARFTRILGSAAEVTRELRRLADGGTPVLANGADTLDGWVAGRWQVFGNGRACVTAAQRRAHAMAAVREAARSEAADGGLNLQARGLVSCVESAERAGAGSDAFENPDAGAGLNPAQRALLAICRGYERRLEEAGLVEVGRAASLLPGAMGASGWEHLVLAGVCDLTDAQRRLLAHVAAHAGVTLALRASAPDSPAVPARAKADALAAGLARACEELGVPVRWEEAAETAGPWRSAEVAGLAAALFHGGEGTPVTPAGDVRFVLPAGRYAEGDAVAQAIVRLRANGAEPRDIVVTCPDPLALARAVSGRLAVERIGVYAAGSRPLALTQPYRALWGLMRLVEAADGPDADAPAPELRPLASDLARNPLLGMGVDDALRLDADWRQRRATSARNLLEGLRTHMRYDEESGGRVAEPSVADGVAARLRAHDVGGALELLEPAAGTPTSERALQRSAFARLQGLVRSATEAWEPGACMTADDLSRLAEGVSVRETWLSVPAQDLDAQRDAAILSINPKAVRVTTLREAAGLNARALVVCGLTADSYSLAEPADAVAHLFEALGLPFRPSAADELRWQFSSALEAASETLVLERPLNDVKAQASRPSALFEELVDCYRPDVTATDDLDKLTGLPRDGSLPCQTEGEEPFDELVSPVGPLDRATTPARVPQLALGPDAGSLLPPDGVLSPSSLESYISCPARWFFERRLPSSGIDAQFGPQQRGTFCHRVLQLFHERLPHELGAPRVTDALLAERGNEADALLDACFDAAVREMRETASDPGARAWDVASCLVATSPLEERELEGLRPRLRQTMRADASFPDGYAPVASEWEFGHTGHAKGGDANDARERAIPYAGILLRGMIDRIDADAEGRALIVDYKGSLSSFGTTSEDGVPLHAQAFMYARALERGSLALAPAGVLYFSYKTAAVTGQASAALTQAIPVDALPFYKGVQLAQSEVDDPFAKTLDVVEECAADAVERMRSGDISARPRFGADSCAYCPLAATCPERKTR